MKIYPFAILFVSLSAALFQADRAEAQPSGRVPWYLEGSFGESRWDPAALSTSQSLGASFDRRDSSYGFVAGLPLGEYLALELGHTNFGKLSANGIVAGQSGSGSPYVINARLKANTTYAAVAAQAPLGQGFTVFGQLGYGSTTRKVSSDAITVPTDAGTLTIFGEDNKNRKSEMLYGFGAGYSFSKTVTGLLRYQKLDDTKASALMLGVRVAL